MSVFKSELNWGIYQDKQLKTLESLSKSLNLTQQGLGNSFGKIESTLTFLGKASEASAKNIDSMTKEWTGTYAELDVSFRGIVTINRRVQESLSKSSKELDNFNRHIGNAAGTFVGTIGSLAKTLWDKLGGLSSIGRSVDEYSSLSNTMIKVSSSDGSTVREFRSSIASIVSDLNKATGYLYNSKEAYRTMVSISQEVTSNTSALKAMSKPVLLASETLDVNINTVAQTFNKFYARYMFSSMNMEDTLDAIRGNTAGNSADAEKVMANINQLQGWINRYAGDDNQLREELMEKVSNYTTWVDSMGLDSSWYTQALSDIAGGNWTERQDLVNILTKAGFTDMTEVTDLVRSGNFDLITQKLIEGMYGYKDLLNNYSYEQSAKNFGLDPDMLLDVVNLVNSKYGFTSFDDFIEWSKNNATTMEDAADDKYVSAADKTNNILSNIYELLARMQELNPLGFGFSDVYTASVLAKHLHLGKLATTAGKAVAGTKAGTALITAANNVGANLAVSGTTIVGNTASTGLALGAGLAGAAAGVGTTIYGVAQGAKDLKNGDKVGATGNFLGAGLGAASAVALGLGAGPVGWALLAGSGLTLLATKAIKSARKVGSVEVIEKAYKEAADSITKSAREQEHSLAKIQANLDTGGDLEEQRTALIESGILTNRDLQKLQEEQRDGIAANKEELDKLTKAYRNATESFTTEQKQIMNKYKREDKEYMMGAQTNLNDLFTDWTTIKYDETTGLSTSAIMSDPSKLKAADDFFYDVKNNLDTKVTSGVVLDEDTQEFYDALCKAYEDEELDAYEFTKLIRSGLFNKSLFKSAALDDTMLDSIKLMGGDYYSDITKGLGTYHGSERAAAVTKVVAKINSLYNEEGIELSKDEVVQMLDGLRDTYNATSEEFPEIGEVAEKYGLSGYREGSNYITKDQLAVLHEGEAVIPKKYNPTINTEGFKDIVTELKEIKEFMKEWKAYTARKDLMNNTRTRLSSMRKVNQYDT